MSLIKHIILILGVTGFSSIVYSQSLLLEVSFESNEYLYTGGYVMTDEHILKIDSAGLYVLTFENPGKQSIDFTDSTELSRNEFYAETLEIRVRKNRIDTVELVLKSTCHKNALTADLDFQGDSASIIVFEGIMPTMYYPGQNDHFISKYKVSFDIFGCIVDINEECALEYNLRIAELLDNKFGPEWRNELPYNVHGITNPIHGSENE